MKPKTLLEKEIVALSATLTPISAEMHSWAEKSIFLKWGVLSRGKFHCLDCMHSWKPDSEKKLQQFTKCTTCNGKLKIHGCNQVHFKEIEYYAVNIGYTSLLTDFAFLIFYKLYKNKD
jgi:hypothetical protein